MAMLLHYSRNSSCRHSYRHGTDAITGREGVDTLTGGSRSDTFIFTTGDTGITLETADTITDFSTGTDKIDIATVGNYVEADGAENANIAAFITMLTLHFTTSLHMQNTILTVKATR